MFRTPALTTAALLGAALLAPTAAGAAGETCQGRPATIVGQPEQVDLRGTEGPDVVVTNGAYAVETLGGDDLVCVMGDYTDVRTGDGDDVVDASAMPADARGVFAYLGGGDDTYLGSAADDEVVTGDDTETDSGTDVVDTGAGDYDLVYSGQVRVPNPDRISGDGLRIWWRGVPATGGAVDGGGDGRFRWYAPRDLSSVVIDARAETLSADVGVTIPMTSFTSFEVDRDRELRTVHFRGSDRDEELRTWGAHPRTAFRIAMGGGDDWVSVGDVAAGSALRGGYGTDHLLVGARSSVALSLVKERVTVGSRRTNATSFEGATVTSPDVTIAGGRGPDELVVNACRATVRGLSGSDTITTKQGTRAVGGVKCRNGRRMTFHGDGGADVLTGGPGADALIGGPGRDRADGGAGRDTCSAERTKRCEVRR